MAFCVITMTIRVIFLKKLNKPAFREKDHGHGAGIPVLKSIWDIFDLSLLFSQSGIRKHSGLQSWLLAFSYICGLIKNVGSANKNAQMSKDSPFLQQLLSGKLVSQSAISRFLSKPFDWLKFSNGRLQRLQDREESRLDDGDVIALDDSKVVHPYGKKIPFLCWLFDNSEKRYEWCMNFVSTLAVLNNGLEYPLLWRFWIKNKSVDETQSKIELARQMLAEIRKVSDARLWVAMDRWFLYKEFLVWLTDNEFEWVTKAKSNTILYRKVDDPVLHRSIYTKLNPKQLLKEVYPILMALGNSSVLSLPDIYIQVPYKTTTKKGKEITRKKLIPIAAVAATYEKPTEESDLIQEVELPATFKNVYLISRKLVVVPNIHSKDATTLAAPTDGKLCRQTRVKS